MGCICYGNDTCNDGLRCADSLCVADDPGGDVDAGVNEPDVEDSDVEDSGLDDAGDSGECNLVPGETYFINIMLQGCPQSHCNFYGTLREK